MSTPLLMCYVTTTQADCRFPFPIGPLQLSRYTHDTVIPHIHPVIWPRRLAWHSECRVIVPANRYLTYLQPSDNPHAPRIPQTCQNPPTTTFPIPSSLLLGFPSCGTLAIYSIRIYSQPIRPSLDMKFWLLPAILPLPQKTHRSPLPACSPSNMCV